MTPLEEKLIGRIADRGPITFADYMEAALYDPDHGYYSAGPPRTGRGGHYVTSPELDAGFGALWAEAVADVWHRCGRPRAFVVAEIGGGEGGFAAALLAAVTGPLAAALRYVLVEPRPALASRQRARLGDRPDVTWVRDASAAGPAGFVFANEVLDNVPVRIVEASGGDLVEIRVGVRDGRLAEVPVPAPAVLRLELARLGVELGDGARFEIAIAARALVAAAAAAVGNGAVVLVDYGDEAAGLAERAAGTLASYSQSGADGDVLGRPGERDITSHANWTTVRAALVATGHTALGPVPQRAVLQGLGLADLDRRLRAEHRAAVAAGAGAAAVAALSRRHALAALADPGGLGGLGVMAGVRGIGPPRWMAPMQQAGPGAGLDARDAASLSS